MPDAESEQRGTIVEIVVGVIGLVGAIIGLAAAVISKKQEVIHRQEYQTGPGVVHSHRPGGLGALVFRSTLFGFAIGTFFGVLTSSTILTLGKLAKDRDEETEKDRIEAAVGRQGWDEQKGKWDESYRAYKRKEYATEMRERREDKYHQNIQAASVSLLPFSFLGTLVGLFIGMKLARLSAAAQSKDAEPIVAR
ncbi:MAG: hypothetical protein L0241_08100 [Planctomycetia bacterium]|nr:hypothetical protein [Planctomycetia bacterium]